MAITIECPSCRERSQVPDSSAGSKGKCRACGTVVVVPGAVAKKTCSACGMDVTRAKRWKDAGNYYCDGCWTTRNTSDEPDLSALNDLEGNATVAAAELLDCPMCQRKFNYAQMDQSGVCKRCAKKTPRAAARHKSGWLSASNEPTPPALKAANWVLIPMLILLIILRAWADFTPSASGWGKATGTVFAVLFFGAVLAVIAAIVLRVFGRPMKNVTPLLPLCSCLAVGVMAIGEWRMNRHEAAQLTKAHPISSSASAASNTDASASADDVDYQKYRGVTKPLLARLDSARLTQAEHFVLASLTSTSEELRSLFLACEKELSVNERRLGSWNLLAMAVDGYHDGSSNLQQRKQNLGDPGMAEIFAATAQHDIANANVSAVMAEGLITKGIGSENGFDGVRDGEVAALRNGKLNSIRAGGTADVQPQDERERALAAKLDTEFREAGKGASASEQRLLKQLKVHSQEYLKTVLAATDKRDRELLKLKLPEILTAETLTSPSVVKRSQGTVELARRAWTEFEQTEEEMFASLVRKIESIDMPSRDRVEALAAFKKEAGPGREQLRQLLRNRREELAEVEKILDVVDRDAQVTVQNGTIVFSDDSNAELFNASLARVRQLSAEFQKFIESAREGQVETPAHQDSNGRTAATAAEPTPNPTSAEAVRASNDHVLRNKKALLIFAHDQPREADAAKAACDKYDIRYEMAASFDRGRTDYSEIHTLIAGSNMMTYWQGANAKPEAFHAIDQFIEKGGHLLVFGAWNGDGMNALAKYGIKAGGQHSWFYEDEPGNTALLFQGHEDLVPSDRRLRSTANLTCSRKHSVLFKRAMRSGGGGPGNLPGDPAAFTLRVQQGRVTVTSVEPFFAEAPETREAYWLIPCMISWVARGAPTVEDGATNVATTTRPASVHRTTPAVGSPEVNNTEWSDAAVEVARRRMLAQLDSFLSDARGRVQKLRSGSDAKKDLADSIRASDAERKKIAATSVQDLRAVLRNAEAQRQQDQQAARATRDERQQELQAARRTKFPGWNGPWTRCLVCEGTGRDELAERKENNRQASIRGSQFAGTNGTRVVGRLAVIGCDLCGGTGQVPDYDR